MPGSVRNYYRFTVEIKGPSVEALSDTVDAVIAGMRFADATEVLASDVASRNAATAAGLAALGHQSDAYACVPRVAREVGHATIASLPTTTPDDGPLAVACSYDI